MADAAHAYDIHTFPNLSTMRGPLDLTGIGLGLRKALDEYNGWRVKYGYEPADALLTCQDARNAGPELRRLMRGMKRLSTRGVHRIAKSDGHLDDSYIANNMGNFTMLSGLFYWNDGMGSINRRLLMLAWRKGARP